MIVKAVKYLKDGFKYGEGLVELRIRHKNGQYLWLENKGKVFFDKDGKKKQL